MPLDVIAVLRERNQLTLPDRLVSALGVGPGAQLALSYDEAAPGIAQLRVLPSSYAGIAGDVYGRTAEDRAAYIAEERAAWDREQDAGRASDGTRYLSFEESRRTYRQTEVTRERYEQVVKLRWPKCEICGRSIARMNDHRRKHAEGRIDAAGVSTEPAQIERSRRRVRKRRATVNARGAKARGA